MYMLPCMYFHLSIVTSTSYTLLPTWYILPWKLPRSFPCFCFCCCCFVYFLQFSGGLGTPPVESSPRTSPVCCRHGFSLSAYQVLPSIMKADRSAPPRPTHVCWCPCPCNAITARGKRAFSFRARGAAVFVTARCFLFILFSFFVFPRNGKVANQCRTSLCPST